MRKVDGRVDGEGYFRATEGGVQFIVDVDREADGRWIGQVRGMPGVLAYGKTHVSAVKNVRALALAVFAAEAKEHAAAFEARVDTIRASAEANADILNDLAKR